MKRNLLPYPFCNAYFVFLLPLFFVFHGYVEKFALISVPDALQLFLFYVFVSCILSVFSYFIFRSWPKAFLFVFILLEVHFFYGSFHDSLKQLFGTNFFTSYRFLIPLILLFFLVSFIFIKNTHKDFIRLTRYLNTVFICLLIVDVGVLTVKFFKNSSYYKNNLPATFSRCDACKKPDVYLILADEYAGYDELKDVFQFDNKDFKNDLINRGFHFVEHSKSNYNFTPFSVASALNFSYLPIRDTMHTATDIAKMMGLIGDNTVTHFFYNQGYKVFNNAIFDLPGEPKQVLSYFLPSKTKYITSQTLLSRIDRDLFYHVVADLKWDWIIKEGIYTNLKSNQMVYKHTIETSLKQGAPKFSYTHLSMPHWPFYFNENGRANSYQTLFDDTNKLRYLSYLKYTNKKLLYLIDQIKKNSRQPPVIILISDHGFRGAEHTPERRYKFLNLCALYLPDGNYTPYYDGMSLVNLFRILLNQQFGQHLPLLRDVTFFLKD